jgi:hypothetical protein
VIFLMADRSHFIFLLDYSNQLVEACSFVVVLNHSIHANIARAFSVDVNQKVSGRN